MTERKRSAGRGQPVVVPGWENRQRIKSGRTETAIPGQDCSVAGLPPLTCGGESGYGWTTGARPLRPAPPLVFRKIMLAVDASRWTLDSPLPDEAALRNVAQLRRYNQQQATISIDSAPPLPSRIGIIGAGIMGLAVALTHARRGLPVRLADACPETLARARPAIRKMAASESIKSGSMGMADATADAGDPAWLDRLAEQVTPVSSLEELSDCDLIFETVVEIADRKRELYARLEPHIRADAILASNTSTLSISNLAAGLKHPQRFCGMHFFNPVSMRPLVEVVCGERTSEAILGAVVAHVRRLGKLPLRVADRPGFLVNRLLMPYLNESLELLAAGATIGQIDQAAERFGMPLGPLALYDLIGIDTSF